MQAYTENLDFYLLQREALSKTETKWNEIVGHIAIDERVGDQDELQQLSCKKVALIL